jgi:hypothetical protein
MRADAPLLSDLTDYTQKNNITLLNIGDSKVARRIMEGTKEARDVVKTIKNLETQRKTMHATYV